MRVNRSGGLTGVQTPKSSSKSKSGKSSSGNRDSVQVSDAAGLREKAHAMLADMSEVRMEQIEAIRSALEEGSFKSDSRKVAVQIVSNALAEHPWS